MKRFWPALLFILVAFLSNCKQPSKEATISPSRPTALQYKLSWIPANKELKVDLLYFPVEQNNTKFQYAQTKFHKWSGQKDLIKGLKNFQVNSPNSFTINESTGIIAISHPNNQPVHITYSIISTYTPQHLPPGQLFRPVITEEEFSLHGISLFLEPLFNNISNKEIFQSVIWENWPKNSTLFQSFDPENRGEKNYTASVYEFMKIKTCIILGGSNLKITSLITDDHIPLYSVTPPQDRITSSDEFNSYCQKYVNATKRFWNDYTDPYFFSVFMPFLPPFDSGVGGMGLYRGHFSRYGNGFRSIEEIKRHYAHEMIHHWISGKIYMDENGHWFSEGFTDYVSIYIMAQQGVLNNNTFQLYLKEGFLEPHYKSNIKNIPNQDLAANFWTLGDYNKLAYRRGCLYAFYLDNQIRLRSDNKYTLRDLLLDIQTFSKQQSSDYALTPEDFIRLTSKYLSGQQVKEDFDNYIIKGNPIIFSSSNLSPFFTVRDEVDIPRIQVIKDIKTFYQF